MSNAQLKVLTHEELLNTAIYYRDAAEQLKERLAAAEARLSDAEGALKFYTTLDTVYMIPPDWSYFKNGGAPTIEDCDSFDASETARAYFASHGEHGDKP